MSASTKVNATGGNGFKKNLKNGSLQPKKLGGTSTKVSMDKAWGKKDPIKVLGMDKLKAEILVGIKADPTKKKLTVVKDTAEVTLQDAKSNTKIAGEKALGGVFSNGIWSKIPQYASGTLNAGTIFAAGEAGPEVVGHVGGRTEVLNKSQLASAMYAAVSSAMAPAASNFAAAAQSMSVNRDGEFNGEMLAEMIRRGVEQAMDRQNELDRQRNDLLRQINQKDSTVEISTSSINKAQTRMNRRAGMTVVPVSST